ncbi:fumarylacetoacetate hydrolase family protein [Mangrovibacter yixingensis]|uniref:fumarylacetoacetate hydrolase family protein n=1 Tax=Mangrovibacter yixingensis TaxID=1529639 RepID=UPI001CF9FB42|nr:fumarylacetoacetate hydrolase family protein [Mangrovibacter yixingensis]
MKLANFIYNEKKHYGIVHHNAIIDLIPLIGEKYSSLQNVLDKNALHELNDFSNHKATIHPREITFLPVIDTPEKILCIGMNYQDKRLEFNEKNNAPTIFVRFPDSQTGHNSLIQKPRISSEFDYEGELAVIIGKECYHVAEKDALEYIAGYSCYMDGSVRDWQHTWYTAGKNWPATGSFGPFLVTRDEIPDPQNLAIKTILNGNIVQNDNTKNMVHKIPEIISYISTFTPLKAGDVIITGSPGGVGVKRQPQLFLQDGDLVEVEIESIGRLSNRVGV